jgi:hypothetical protein
MPRAALVALLALAQPSVGTPFQPWVANGFRIVNAVEFNPDGLTMYVSLFYAEVAKVTDLAVAPGSPEVALFYCTRQGAGWSEPTLMPFAGEHQDYEASIAPDGAFMIFNSLRPLPDGTPVPKGKNNLWLSRRTANSWSEPVYLSGVNRASMEESYAAIARDGRVIYVREGAVDAHGPDFDLHLTRLTGDTVSSSAPFAPAATAAGEGDPWMAPDGSYVIFTRWDRSRPWEETVALQITFDRGGRWTAPVPLTELDTPNAPEYAVTVAAIKGQPETIYWKTGGRTMQAAWAPILAAARARAK